jgi:hypothetical protein
MTSLINRTYYTETYHGDAVPVSVFDRIAIKATAELNRLTNGRILLATGDNLDKAKLCVCAICDWIWRAESAGGLLPTSESVGSEHSMSAQGTTLEAQIRNEAATWLNGTGLLFRGL